MGGRGPQVAELQRALLRLGYYGIRFAIDGEFGRNTLGAVLACKYDLVNYYGIPPEELGYAPARAAASGQVTGEFARCVEALLATGALGGRQAWLLPSRAQVADAEISVAECVEAEAQAAGAPAPLLREILAVESGASHFDGGGYVKFNVDWCGRAYGQVVNFTPGASWEPWVRSRGWGLAQYTPHRVAALPRPMPDYILSVRANIRAAARLFAGKFRSATLRLPCSYPAEGAGSHDCGSCLRARGFDPAAYSDRRQQPCSWLKAVWAYNGLSPAGRKYMERVALNILR